MKKIYLIILLYLITIFSYGQSTLITPAKGHITVCPGEGKSYSVIPGNFSECGTVTWTVTNGTFTFGSSVTSTTAAIDKSVTVFWNDVAGTGTLRATATCSQGGALGVTETYAIRSLANRLPANARSNQTLPYCSTVGLVLNVDAMFLENTGGTTGIDLERADGYEWVLPSGWSSSGSTGTITTPFEFLNIEPSNGCSGGTVTVRAFKNCTSGKKFSSAASIPVNRIPLGNIGVPSGYTGPTCGTKTPVTFTAASLHCATSYRWTFPSGWKTADGVGGSFTTATNSIALTPSGSQADDGIISVDINLGCGTLTQTYRANYTNPPLPKPVFSLSPSTICSGGSVTLRVQPITGASNYTWYTETRSHFAVDQVHAIAYLNDAVRSSTAPLVTASNQVTLRVPNFSGTVRYSITVFVRADKTGCAGSPTANTVVWAGPPLQAHTSVVYIPGFRGVNPVTVAPEGLYNIQIDNVPGATSYRWELPSGMSFLSGFGTTGTMIKAWTASANGNYTVRCFPQGTCGSAGTGASTLTLRVTGGTGGGGNPPPPCRTPPCAPGPQPASVFPNPSSDRITVLTGSDDQAKTQVTLYNSTQQQVYSTFTQDESVDVDLLGLPKGIYYLEIKNKDTTKKERITIK